jgi:glycerol-3-phosphate acyltransferase PlsY
MLGLNLLIVVGLAYLIGAIPFAYVAGKVFRQLDLREHGSNNLGATNAVRVLGWKIGLLVLFADIAKGVIATAYVSRIQFALVELDALSWGLIAGFAAVFGHIFSCFVNFRGGKGVATSAGMFLALAPLPTFFCICVFIGMVLLTRRVSVGSLSAALALPFAYYFCPCHRDFEGSHLGLQITMLVVTSLVWISHVPNLKRLWRGEEKRLF